MEILKPNFNVKFFVDNYWENRNEIFEYIYEVLEKENETLEENQKIHEFLEQKYNKEKDKKIGINSIKYLTLKKYIKNFNSRKKREKSEEIEDKLRKYDLDLQLTENPFAIKLIHLEKNQASKNNDDKNQNINDKNDYNSIFPIFNIDFIDKIKISDDEEWICNAEYGFYLITDVFKLNNPHPIYIEDNHEEPDESESSFSLNEYIDLEHLIFFTNNRNDRNKKIIELEGNLNISDIYKDIKENSISPEYEKNQFIKKSIPGIIIEKDIKIEDYVNNEIWDFFRKIYTCKNYKTVIFQDKNKKSNYDKIVSLNELYLKNSIRFLYLDLNIINSIKSTNEKRQYLSYYIARIYSCRKNFKEDFENFVNSNLKNVRSEKFIYDLIKKIIEKNEEMINKEKIIIPPFFIVFDNIDSAEYFRVFEEIIDENFNGLVQIFGVINIESKFGKSKFISLYNKGYYDRGFYIKYLCSFHAIENLEEDILSFFNEIGKNINTLKDFIQLMYYQDYINEYDKIDKIDITFLMKYIKYIYLDVKEDCNNSLTITNIKFKNQKIEEKFTNNYRDILLNYLNINNNNNEIIDKNLDDLFSGVNGIFFEKQILLDILLDRIKNKKEENILLFKELKVQSIYCMKLNTESINLAEYKDKNIIITQISKTGEIYDFAIIIGNTVKLYQVSINKPEKKLIKLYKGLIETDCQYMKMKVLNKIRECTNFNFGLIISKFAFYQYAELIKNNDKKYLNTPYYLMKKYSEDNQYELLIYDLYYNKFFIEGDSYELIEYNNFYEFVEEKKLNVNGLEDIFNLNPEKMSIKKYKKDNLLEKLNKTNLFNTINEKNKEFINIIAKFKYDKKFLHIEKIKEENICLCISHKDEDRETNIFKYKDNSIYNSIKGKNSTNKVYDPESINIPKKNTEIILFDFEKDIKFLGMKRKGDSL